ncbi:MAG: phosphotriesterase-related protein [SAR202 cluster bacterium]|nr:phosphotriesterase-related protein [SAR202 cluster bacterium]
MPKGKSKLSGKIQTVLGPIEPDRLGITSTHEHLLIDLSCYFQMPEEASRRADVHAKLTMDMIGRMEQAWYYNLDNNYLFSVEQAIEEVMEFKLNGGNSIVDTTNRDLARDPLALARISRATGLNIIMGAGHYVPVSHPADMDKRSETQIAEQIIKELTEGVGDTGVKPGVIGELGNVWPLTPNQKKVLRAAAKAQVETGAPILIHPGQHNDGPMEILDILTESGAEPEHIIMGHLDFAIDDRKALKRLAKSGCFLEYDIFGIENTGIEYMGEELRLMNDVQRIETIEFLAEEGHIDQVLTAQDVCQKRQLTAYGGKGYGHILGNIIPRMKKRGFTQAQVDKMLVHNPARALAFK